MPVSGRAVAIAWVGWTALLGVWAWWEWRQIMDGKTLGVVIEISSRAALVGGFALLYSPVLVLTAIWLWSRVRAAQ